MRKILIISLLLVSFLSFPQEEIPLPGISLQITPNQQPRDLVNTLEILLLLTVLSLAPSILILFTSFTRIIVVFSFVRNALGTRQTPPNQILIGLALFLTFFIMQPVWNDIYNNAITPYLNSEIGYEEMFSRSMDRLRTFMLTEIKIHHNEDNIYILAENVKKQIDNIEDTPNSILIPAFVIGELEIGFKMGILLYIPFIVMDMVVASILLSLGMIMIPPVLVSLPFKILLFVLVNGWDILIGSLIKSFGGG
ncbi:flagellar biosynthesis protein flip [Thermosipho melanesiensis]|uniref:Flagellar biosynthetic protein FliP n=2 Tax=Thermosipho melanesiensis TaxID=46541 RepID=A6LLI9_THEM4|nr:flagellar type III secretion system pore protein FliP [Thermosipho melanesiensis]ABR30790.1 flagellar biosynthetic protein FliP [Thermosipho melanesiensis BI429]APT73911.1 flagellar biosynthesis protein FliP [Thermosipho melanesiensis]OOC35850.1 flagellar biosynthesis protein flip [Thermosipho melanesiensis]OOC38352.1 flagellar biosynthesis protein flip [Thermosipho melanesiensis]OOC38813.1 flagellar biosynthesis protein flip [Thermosipho melanesiensis]